MNDGFIKMINNIDFLYGFIYECANLINNLSDYDNCDNSVVKLCSEFVMPIINITKKKHIKEYNKHNKDIKNIISVLEHNKHSKNTIIVLNHNNKGIFRICSYLMNICCERYFKLSRDEYLEIKEFIDNNIDITESAFAPMIDYFDLYKKCYNH